MIRTTCVLSAEDFCIALGREFTRRTSLYKMPLRAVGHCHDERDGEDDTAPMVWRNSFVAFRPKPRSSDDIHLFLNESADSPSLVTWRLMNRFTENVYEPGHEGAVSVESSAAEFASKVWALIPAIRARMNAEMALDTASRAAQRHGKVQRCASEANCLNPWSLEAQMLSEQACSSKRVGNCPCFEGSAIVRIELVEDDGTPIQL